MVIQCLKKFSLLDYPGKAACTLFTAGCNFRCPFCHNRGLVVNPPTGQAVSEEEIFTFFNVVFSTYLIDFLGFRGIMYAEQKYLYNYSFLFSSRGDYGGH